jgi:23S rRNA (cytidine1920-2'-O)/16S rRNA (cytidine1409-2'-O)-methyltransferase
MIQKERLDILLAQRGLCPTREQAQRCVLAGEVWQGMQRLEKPGVRLPVNAPIELRSRSQKFVSRGGFKLEHALETFGLCVQDRVCLDVGASTGGFTDCLLQRGANRVFAVDCGHGQLDHKMRTDARVISLEKVNARHMNSHTLADAHSDASDITFVCADASFISLKLLIAPVLLTSPRATDWVLLFKPQFEVGPENVGKGGLVRNQAAVTQSLAEFDVFMTAHHFVRKHAPLESPVTGKKSGNTEILLHYEKV